MIAAFSPIAETVNIATTDIASKGRSHRSPFSFYDAIFKFEFVGEMRLG